MNERQLAKAEAIHLMDAVISKAKRWSDNPEFIGGLNAARRTLATEFKREFPGVEL